MKDYIKETSKSDAKPLSKEELIARLKAIASDGIPREENYGAMCYSPSPPLRGITNCDTCGREINYVIFMVDIHSFILEHVRRIAELGYDVKVETACSSCAEKIKKELYGDMESDGEECFDKHEKIRIGDLNHIFYFRLPDDIEYHRTIANREGQYAALLTLLQNEQKYGDYFGNSHYIADDIDTLEFMTGIKFDI